MEIFRELQQHLPPFIIEVLRLGIWLVLLMLIFLPLERLFTQNPQKIFRKNFVTDLGYYFINSILPARALVILMAALAWGMHYFVVPDSFHQWVAQMSIWERFAAAMIVGEIGSYWGHRWSHEIPWLWRFHAIHHSAEQIDWLVNTRAHPVDMIFTRMCGILPMFILGLIQPVTNTADPVILIVMLAGTMWGFFIHANVRWRFGWLEWFISPPAFHHWHHTNDDPMLINKNYSAMIPWVDKLFGTYYLPRQWPGKYGINEKISSSITEQLLQPFEKRV